MSALVGRNGAGKSTLFRVLTGLLRPDAGTVSLDDPDVLADAGSRRRWRARLGWLPQQPPLPRRLRVRDVVGDAAWLRGQDSKADEAVAQALVACDLEPLAGRRLGTLSGGEQCRASLAFALVGGPSLLLLDEPTVGLDPEQRQHLLDVIRQQARAGATVLLSTHLMEDVLGAADRVLVLEGGRVCVRSPRPGGGWVPRRWSSRC